MTATFFGHADFYPSDATRKALEDVIEHLIIVSGVDTFLVGGMGHFDGVAASAVHSMKKRYPEHPIELDLVIPYRTADLQRNKTFYETDYDNIIFPDAVWGSHPKGAITKRNRWMIQQSQFLICYVDHSWGGAWQALEYAKRQSHISIQNLADLPHKSTH